MSNLNQSTDGTLEQIARVVHVQPEIAINKFAQARRDEQDKRQTEETRARLDQRDAQNRAETIRNLLVVVNNPTSDEVIINRANKELEKFRGDENVDAHFQFLDDERKREAYKAKREEWFIRAKALKECAVK